MKNTWKLLMLLSACLLPVGGQAEIHTSSTITEVAPLFEQEGQWILVDLDNCLFQGAGCYGHAEFLYDHVREAVAAGSTKAEAIAEFYPMWMEAQKVCLIEPVEPEFIELLKSLQEQGYIVMGLTHRQPVSASITIDQVNSLGIDFTTSAVREDSFQIAADHYALYESGVIFCNDNNSKGDVLKSFLAAIEPRPELVLFIDDGAHNVEDVGSTLYEMSIPFTGIHYTAVKNAPKEYSRLKAYQEGLHLWEMRNRALQEEREKKLKATRDLMNVKV